MRDERLCWFFQYNFLLPPYKKNKTDLFDMLYQNYLLLYVLFPSLRQFFFYTAEVSGYSF